MNKRKKDTRWLASVALMMAVVILLASTPLGMIQLPVVKATTVHIPVILGAILLGPLAGSILGGVFGICSMVSNTMADYYQRRKRWPYTAILCVFTVYEHDRDFRSRKGSVDFRWMPDLNRFFCRMALDFTVKM